MEASTGQGMPQMTGRPSSTGRGENDFPRFHGGGSSTGSFVLNFCQPELQGSSFLSFQSPFCGTSLRQLGDSGCSTQLSAIASPQARPGLERARDSGSWFPEGETRSHREKELHLIDHTHPKQSDWGGICTSWVPGRQGS